MVKLELGVRSGTDQVSDMGADVPGTRCPGGKWPAFLPAGPERDTGSLFSFTTVAVAVGTLKTRDWKTQDWKTREHHVYG